VQYYGSTGLHSDADAATLVESQDSNIEEVNRVENQKLATNSSHFSDKLYFFEYPDQGIGPAHIAWGYWALDEQGEYTSTITSCVFKNNQWFLELNLNGLVFWMQRRVFSSS
jgi:hypothetical protein